MDVGDQLLFVDGKDVQEMTLGQCLNVLRETAPMVALKWAHWLPNTSVYVDMALPDVCHKIRTASSGSISIDDMRVLLDRLEELAKDGALPVSSLESLRERGRTIIIESSKN